MAIRRLSLTAPFVRRVSSSELGAANVQISVVSGIVRLSPSGPLGMAKVLHSEADALSHRHNTDRDTYSVLFVRWPFLSIHLRQANDEAPPFPQKPDSTGDNVQLTGVPRHDHAYVALLPSRGHGLLETI